jgi:hypothetical protein
MFQQDDSLKHGFNHSFQFKVRPRLQLSIVMSFPATSRYELLTKSSALTAFLRLSLLLYCTNTTNKHYFTRIASTTWNKSAKVIMASVSPHA